MSFNIDAVPLFWTTVQVVGPDGQAHDFRVKFEALSIEELLSFKIESPAGAEAFLRRAVQGVSGLVDNAGGEVPDTADLRSKLYNIAWVRAPMITSYIAAINGAAQFSVSASLAAKG